MTASRTGAFVLALGTGVILFGVGGALAVEPRAHSEQVSARLTGAAEAPGPGDPDGSGSATVTLDASSISMDGETPTRICYTLSVSGIDPATMAHIHRGAAGAAGPVVVSLATPANGASNGCVNIDADLAAQIMTAPGGFYVNVHNAAYPGGAVRGQLSD